MAFMGREAFAAVLACPRCRMTLTCSAVGYRCGNSDCPYSLVTFPELNGRPVLIDFDDSILLEEQVLSERKGEVIKRKSSSAVKRRILGSLLPGNPVAAKNAARVIALAKSQDQRPRILIVGGGSAGAGTESLYEDADVELVCFDIYQSDLIQFIADAHRIPLRDETFDVVWVQAVLEHVLDPGRVVEEIYRVLRIGGVLYAETPFMQQVHEGPYDFTRFTESGHRWLFRRFARIDSGAAMGPATQLIWSIEHVVRGLFRSVRAGSIAHLAFFWLKYLDLLIPAHFAVDGASAVFFLGRKSTEILSPKAMPACYRGAYGRGT